MSKHFMLGKILSTYVEPEDVEARATTLLTRETLDAVF